MKEPNVSIIMAVYNYKKHLKESIDSILNQSYSDFEFLIMDGGSTDGTSEIIGDYDDPRIRHVRSDDNPGFTPMLMQGVNISRGNYIARHDADDISKRSRIKTQVEYLDKFPEISILGTSYRVINDDGKDVKNIMMSFQHDDVLRGLRYGSPFPHGSVMMRRKVLEDFNYDPIVEKSQDYDLWMRIGKDGSYKFRVIPDTLYFWRDHDESIGNTQWMQQFLYSERARLISEGWSDITPERILHLIENTIFTRSRRRFLAHKYRRLFYTTTGVKRIYYLMISTFFEPNYLKDGIAKRIYRNKEWHTDCIDYTDWKLCSNCNMMHVPPDGDICVGCKRDRLWYIG